MIIEYDVTHDYEYFANIIINGHTLLEIVTIIINTMYSCLINQDITIRPNICTYKTNYARLEDKNRTLKTIDLIFTFPPNITANDKSMIFVILNRVLKTNQQLKKTIKNDIGLRNIDLFENKAELYMFI